MLKKIIIVLLSISFILSLPTYVYDRGVILNISSWVSNWLFGTKFGIASIRPNLLSSLAALVVISPYVIKKRCFDFKDVNDLLILALDICLVSSFLSCFISSETKDVFFLFQWSPMAIALLLFVLPKRYIKFGWITAIFIVFSICQLSFISEAMGLCGAIYVICGFIALVLQEKAYQTSIYSY